MDSEVTSWGGVIVTPGTKAYEKEEKPEEGETMESEESAETSGEATSENPTSGTPTSTELEVAEAEEKMETTAS